jgi:hypothetical protein
MPEAQNPATSMAFNQSARVPFVCDIGAHKNLHVPRFLRRDWKAWAAEEDKRRREEALAQFGDDQEAKAKFLAFYIIPPISPREVRSRLGTYEGQEEVIRRSLRKLMNGDGKQLLSNEQIEEFLEVNDPIDLEIMAWELACIRKEVPQTKQDKKENKKDEENEENPS